MVKMGKSKRFIAIVLTLLQIICGLNLNALEVYAWGGGGTQYEYTGSSTESVQTFVDAHPEMFNDSSRLPILVSYNIDSGSYVGKVNEIYYVNSTGTIHQGEDGDAIYYKGANLKKCTKSSYHF